MNTIKQRLEKLRALMSAHGIQAYYIPTSDFHASEYVGDYFATQRFMSGFTGEGTLVVLMNEAGLWTDGRYFLQGSQQLEGTTIELMRMGEEGVPSIEEYFEAKLSHEAIIGMDGRYVSASFGNKLLQSLSKKDVSLMADIDLVGEVWGQDRPKMSQAEAFVLKKEYAGKCACEKLSEIREAMREKHADVHVLTTLDDIAWLFNLRGADVKCNPVLLSYAIIERENAYLFVDDEKLTADVREHLDELSVTVLPYNDVYSFVARYDEGTSIMLSTGKVNYALYNALRDKALVIDAENPTVLKKAMKNETELKNVHNAHIKDGVAVTRFMHYVKENVGKTKLTEISLGDKLEGFRKEQEGFLYPSFDTIMGYGPHGAIIHYSATPETDVEVKPQGLLLVDSGGQYYEGTTDITRTLAVGELTKDERTHFTMVLRSTLALQNAKFAYGARGVNLDILAREPLWERGLDYRHGTGHGVGYLLNVHEQPNGFRWKVVPERNDSAVFEPGMITTDEPGYYADGMYGIRHENELVCKEYMQTEYGRFLCFEPVTFVPFDLDAIDASMMSDIDKARLNAYHKLVYETLAPYMEKDELSWLKHYTREI